MGIETTWRLHGRSASEGAIAETLALARQSRAKRAEAEQDARDGDAHARAVGSAARRAADAGSRPIGCTPRPVRGTSCATSTLLSFGRLFFQNSGGRSYVDARGFSSFHFKFRPRGLGKSNRPYRRGEAVVAVRYIFREAAREIDGGGIASNISPDPDRIAALFNALEELEMVGGRVNANVYTTLVVSLPHELDAAGRLGLLEQICGVFDKLGIPYAGALHAPDPEGDQRNFHAHVILSWRPFEHADDGYRFAATTLGAMNQSEFMTSSRQHAAECMNTAMAVAGHARRFTPGQLDTAPGAAIPGPAKIGRGQKLAQRRKQAIADGKAERALLIERAAAIGDLKREVEAVLVAKRVPRAPILERCKCARRNWQLRRQWLQAA